MTMPGNPAPSYFDGPTMGKAVPVDLVNHPPHYKSGGMEVIDVIEAFGLEDDLYLANVIKYLLRHRSKGGEVDLQKGLWYLERRVRRGKEASGARHSQ